MKQVTTPIVYENPPIDEIACAVTFDSIDNFRSSHFGGLWYKFRPDFSEVDDRFPIHPQPDVTNDKPPLPRAWFIHKNHNEIIQVQKNRFIYNWRKTRTSNKYPGYKTVVENFVKHLNSFELFLKEENLGIIIPREYELTYIDIVTKGNGWDSISDLGFVFPELLSLKIKNEVITDIKGIDFQIEFLLPNSLGNLLVAIRDGQIAHGNEPRNQAAFQMEFRLISNYTSLSILEWFNQAHDAIVYFFTNIVNLEIQEKFWGRK